MQIDYEHKDTIVLCRLYGMMETFKICYLVGM